MTQKIKLLFFFLFLICPLTAFANDQLIKLSALLHLTGTYSMEGAAFREGIEIAVDEINDQGGISGKKIKVNYEDTLYKQLNALTAAKKVISKNDSLGVIISTLHEAKSSAPVLEKAKLPTILLWDASTELENMGDYIFSIGPFAPDTGKTAAEFAINKLQAKSAYVLSNNHDWSLEVSRAFKENSLKIIGHQDINLAETDFRSILLKVKNSNPDVVYAPLVENIVLFVKQYKQLKINTPLIMSDNVSELIIKQAQEAFEGLYATSVADPQGELANKLKEKYFKKYGKKTGLILFNAWGYDALKLFAWAIEKAGENQEAIKNVLSTAQNFPGVTGNISMSAQGSSPRPISVFIVKNGGLQLLF